MADTNRTAPAPQEANPTEATGQPVYAPEQEVRFAVVMYGGVSLAVYINGVAQELLRLVRATAPAQPTSAPPSSLYLSEEEVAGSSMAVYRKIGRMLGLTDRGAGEVSDVDPVRTRFVVDIISGTSAGGINAIFLAKALANGQDLEGIKRLWTEQADLALLLNDRRGNKGLGTTPQDPPNALLSSARIYRDLLDALEQMEAPTARTQKGEARSLFADEIDVFLTATDLWGLTLPIRLADKVIYENRYRNVFHFRYATPYAAGEERNDFHAGNHPFLAFAARCTSAFPFAFEPMTLGDIDESLRGVPAFSCDPNAAASSPEWKQFFKDYDRPDDQAFTKRPFTERPFGDGGYLDNYPFSYAIDTLQRRSADVPVVRKMLYVEPAPGHPEVEKPPEERPDFFDNVLKALVEIPRSETIREDLQRTLGRNQLIERLTRITADLEKDVKLAERSEAPFLSGDVWAKQDLGAMILRNGAGYGAYHRLKVYSVTDDITRTITRLATGLEDASDQFLAVRYLVRAWREAHYITYLDQAPPGTVPLTQNRFLLDFDLGYRLRRLNFVRRKADDLYRKGVSASPGAGGSPDQTEAERASFRQALLQIKRGLTEAFVLLRRTERSLNDPAAPNADLLAKVQDIARDVHIPGTDTKSAGAPSGLTNAALLALLAPCSESRREANATEMVDVPENCTLLQKFADALAECLGAAFKAASEQVCRQFDGPLDQSEAESAARKALKHYYDYFDAYDMVTFPTIYGTGVGEPVQVDVHRVSPEDAILPFSEDGDRKKLAGTTFGHFGAFLQRIWRVNDMLWGRLDGAERIIRAITPHLTADQQRPLIEQAQRAIIVEEIPPGDREQIVREMMKVLLRTEGQRPGEPRLPLDVMQLRRYLQESVGSRSDLEHAPTLKAFLQACITDEQLVGYLAKEFRVDTQLIPEPAIRLAARASEVVGRMFDGLARNRRFQNPVTGWMPVAGRVLVGIAEAAVPRSLWNLSFRYWVKLLYLFEVILLALGLFHVLADVGLLGEKLLAGTLLLDGGVRLTNRWMRGYSVTWGVMRTLLIILLLLIGVEGVRQTDRDVRLGFRAAGRAEAMFRR